MSQAWKFHLFLGLHMTSILRIHNNQIKDSWATYLCYQPKKIKRNNCIEVLLDLIEVLLQALIGIVDEKLLKKVARKDLVAKNVKNAHKGMALK